MSPARADVSVIIPAWNAARFIAEAVESALGQTRPPREVIVVDDGSSDGTREVVERLAGVRCLGQRHAGISAARNRGVAAAGGRFLAFLDADDRWTPDKLARQVAAAEADPGLEMVLGHCVEVPQARWPDTMAATGPPPAARAVPGYVPGTCLVGAAAFARVGGFDVALRAGEFIDWFLRARAAGLRFRLLAETVLWRRVHDASHGTAARADYADYAQALKRDLDRRRALAGGLMATTSVNYWPTSQQRLLLIAALGPDRAAAEAWREVRPRLDLDALDAATTRLLPLVHRSLRRLGIDDPILARCAGIHRYHWSRNQMLFHRGAAVLTTLDAAGVPHMVLKGGALVAGYYGDPGLRAMEDLDVLVPAPAVTAAAAALGRSGWQARYRLSSSFLRVKHAAPFTDGGGRHLDLHWHVFEECCGPDDDRDLWGAAETIDFAGRRTRILCPADQLLHACVHGARWAPVAGIRWIADAVTIARARDIDWGRVVEQAGRRRFALRMADTLGFLRETLEAPVPAEVVRELAAGPHRRFERLERRLLGREHRWLGQLPVYWCHHLRARGGDPLRAAVTFPRYLQHAWDLAGLGELPRGALRRAIRRLGAGARATSLTPPRRDTAP